MIGIIGNKSGKQGPGVREDQRRSP
jgi:hypothetical protein